MANVAWKVEIEFVDGVWTDVTADVDTIRTPIAINSGDTAESTGDTGSLTIVFNNPTQEYTPGNQLSSRYPNFTSGKRIRVSETILDQVVYVFTGFIAFPNIEAWTRSSSTEPRDQMITISAVDRLAKIYGGATFVSTLAEHIMANSRGALQLFLPLNEEAAPATAIVGSATLKPVVGDIYSGLNPTDPQLPTITWADGAPAPGDDASCVRFLPSRDVSSGVTYPASYHLEGDISLALAAGQVATVVVWVRTTEIAHPSDTHLITLSGAANFQMQISYDANSLLSGLAAQAPDWVGGVTGASGGIERMFPVALRFGFDPAVVELWTSSAVYTDVMSVTTASAASITGIKLGRRFNGCLAYAQIYIGAESDWTHDDFLAQYEVGLQGLERQTSGDRIRTILGYVGVPGSELGQIADGVALMQRVSLRDRNPGDVLAEAVETEQGLFYAAGDGVPVFVDRIGLYNI